MKGTPIMILAALTLLLLAGCQLQIAEENTTATENKTNTAEIGEITTEPATNELMLPEEGIVLEATEGDLISLKPEAIDPDGDVVSYTFTKPFNENGKWQSKEGDAGQYLVTVTASDGKANTTEDVLIIVHKANKAPIIECPEEVVVKEGEIISLTCNVYDPEGESVVVEYSGFMKTSTYQTTFDDAGDYTVQIKAKDSQKESTSTVKIKILDVNRASEITGVPEEIKAMETDVVTINPQAIDPDGDKVVLTFSEPFNDKGVWATKIGDAGTHKASVMANDGKSTIKKDFQVIISQKNTAPVLKKINDITVSEGDTIKLPIEATDREGDQLKVEVKGWMNSQEYTTTYDDAGKYTVTVIVSDDEFEAKQTFQVTVLDKNRAPIFKVPA